MPNRPREGGASLPCNAQHGQVAEKKVVAIARGAVDPCFKPPALILTRRRDKKNNRSGEPAGRIPYTVYRTRPGREAKGKKKYGEPDETAGPAPDFFFYVAFRFLFPFGAPSLARGAQEALEEKTNKS